MFADIAPVLRNAIAHDPSASGRPHTFVVIGEGLAPKAPIMLGPGTAPAGERRTRYSRREIRTPHTEPLPPKWVLTYGNYLHVDNN